MRCLMLIVLSLVCLMAGAAPAATTSTPPAVDASAPAALPPAVAAVPSVPLATAPLSPAPASAIPGVPVAEPAADPARLAAPTAPTLCPGSVAPADRVASAVGSSALSIQPELIDSILQSPAVQRLVDRLIADQQTPWSVKLGYSGLGVGVGVVLTILIYGAVQ